ncbi:MAG: methylaspartate ammonia-lyase [archaeon]
MAKVKKILATQGLGGFWNDDNEAIKRGAEQDGFAYRGKPITPGFETIRQPAVSVSIMLILDNGELCFGDCIWVQYGGERAGREKLASPRDIISLVREELEPWLVGRQLDSFRTIMADLNRELELPRAVKYGVSQAVLDVVAKSQRKTMAEILAQEYDTTIENKPLTFFTQSGDNYYHSVDKMILRRIPVLPHGLVNSVSRVQKLPEYVKWTRERIRTLVPDRNYNPILHYDLYGNLGVAYGNDIEKIITFLRELEEIARPLRLQIEDPVLMPTKKDQITMMSRLRTRIGEERIKIKLVVDEWAPTHEDKVDFIKAGAVDICQIKPPDLGGVDQSVESILHCKSEGVGAYLGGSCTETARSAEVSVHIALATAPIQVLAKPGMGVDEGVSIMYNEMQRTLALIFDNASSTH